MNYYGLVGVTVGVFVGVGEVCAPHGGNGVIGGVLVGVGIGCFVGVLVGVRVTVTVGVFVVVGVGVNPLVGVTVGVGVGITYTKLPTWQFSESTIFTIKLLSAWGEGTTNE